MLTAIGSIIAIPPTLLLAFFGASTNDVDGTRSIMDISAYWPAYLLAWLPFTALLAVDYVLRRRIRAARLAPAQVTA